MLGWLSSLGFNCGGCLVPLHQTAANATGHPALAVPTDASVEDRTNGASQQVFEQRPPARRMVRLDRQGVEARRAIEGILGTLRSEGWCLPEQLELLESSYTILLEQLGQEGARDLIGDTAPATFSVDERGVLSVQVDEEALCELFEAAQAGMSASQPDARAEAASRRAVEERLGSLEPLRGDQRVKSERSPFPLAFWTFAAGRSEEWGFLLYKSAVHSEAKYRLASGGELRQAGTYLAALSVNLHNFLAASALPEGYGRPLEEMSARLEAQWKIMAQLVQDALVVEPRGNGSIQWSDAQKAQYDAARLEANWCLRELQQTMLVLEEKIGVDGRFCELLDRLINESVTLGECEKAKQTCRLKLLELGEHLHLFYAARDEKVAEAVLDGKTGVMDSLLGFCSSYLERAGRVHQHLYLHTKGGDWPAERGRREDWTPLAFGVLSDGHYTAYVETAAGCLLYDNMDRLGKGGVWSEEDARQLPSKAQLYVHRDALSRVRPAFHQADKWNMPTWEGNNCWIAVTVLLLTAHHVAGHALDSQGLPPSQEKESALEAVKPSPN